MHFVSLLNAMTDVTLLEQGYAIGLDWLGHFARVIIEGVGIVGLGIIVFNLVLKAITLPFDIYQRAKMRKQNLIMQKMQPELEKLQKQYRDDKDMYNQKMYELQKKNGYSMLGACLPMIVSFVILIVAWQGFRAYSQYANLNYYEKMSVSYNAAVMAYGADGLDPRFVDGAFTYTENGEQKTLSVSWENGAELPISDGISYIMTDVASGEETRKYLTVESKDETKYIFYIYNLETDALTREYKIDLDRFAAAYDALPDGEKTDALTNALSAYRSDASAIADYAKEARAYVEKMGAEAAAEQFRKNDPSFLWIKNVWYPDVSYDHPIAEYSDFVKDFNNVKVTTADGEEKLLTNVLTNAKYNALTSMLNEEKEAPNGYFILIVLSIGFMLLSQLIAMKSNKAANKYQTVDGQGARTQKIMLVVMPLIYALFAFQYSAAFSIYMTMSSIVAILVTLFCNLILDNIFKKKEEQAEVETYTRKLPWMKDDEKGKNGGKPQGKTRKK